VITKKSFPFIKLPVNTQNNALTQNGSMPNFRACINLLQVPPIQQN